MRLRPSQFVFLLLLACSVRISDGCVFGLTASAISGSARGALQTSHLAPASAQSSPITSHAPNPPAQALRLDAAATAAHRTIWAMRQPNAESAAVSSFTSLLRA